MSCDVIAWFKDLKGMLEAAVLEAGEADEALEEVDEVVAVLAVGEDVAFELNAGIAGCADCGIGRTVRGCAGLDSRGAGAD